MNENTTTTKRVTKAQRFEDIKAILNGDAVVYGTTVEDAISVIDHELELLAKKNSSDSKKSTELQEKNAVLCDLIVEHLAGLPEDSEGMTCGELNKAIPELYDFNNQKIAYLVRMLSEAGRVTKREVKGKMRVRLA